MMERERGREKSKGKRDGGKEGKEGRNRKVTRLREKVEKKMRDELKEIKWNGEMKEQM